MIRRLVPALAAAALLAPAAPAEAKTTAQRFADAFERAASTMDAREPEFRAAFAAIEIDRCATLFHDSPTASEREEDLLDGLLIGAMNAPVYRTGAPVLAQLVADLDVIETRDPALRSVRAVWRAYAARSARVAIHDRPCERIEAWARSGFAADKRPRIDLRVLGELIDWMESDAVEDKLERGTRRLRRLGVRPSDAQRLDGERIFLRPILPLIEAFARADYLAGDDAEALG